MSYLGLADFRPRRVLVVDDDTHQREAIAGYLALHGLTVETAADAEAMQRRLATGPVEVILLDVLMPPGEDGLTACRKMADAKGPPVILMSDAADAIDRIVGLELGADDYLAKPCNPREVLARVRAVLRRSLAPYIPSELAARFAGWRLDMLRHDLRDANGAAVHLPSAEYALLRAFLERPGRILSRLQLVDYAFDHGVRVSERAIDIRACRLRKALNRCDGPDLIRTVRHQGYLFTPEVVFET